MTLLNIISVQQRLCLAWGFLKKWFYNSFILNIEQWFFQIPLLVFNNHVESPFQKLGKSKRSYQFKNNYKMSSIPLNLNLRDMNAIKAV